MTQNFIRTGFRILLLATIIWAADQLASSTLVAHAQADKACATTTPQIKCEALTITSTGVLVDVRNNVPSGFSCANVSAFPQIECEALIAIADANPAAKFPNDWWKTTTPCDWAGVICQEGRFTIFALTDNWLTELPPEIGNLSSLEEISLVNNQLERVSPEIGNLTSLKTIFLADNQLTNLPPEMGKLSSLNVLSLEITR